MKEIGCMIDINGFLCEYNIFIKINFFNIIQIIILSNSKNFVYPIRATKNANDIS